MKLNVKERLVLLQVLPKEGSFVTMKIQRDLITKVGFSEEELKDFELKEVEGRVAWNPAKDVEKDIVIGEKASDLIVEQLKKMDKEGKVNNDVFSLYEKFVVNQ